MPVTKRNLMKNPNIGLFMFATDAFCLVPDYVREKDVEEIGEVLDVPVIPTRIAGTSLLGAFVSGNSRGIVVPWIVREEEVKKLKENGIEVLVVKDRVTALGNLIAANDKGAIISESVSLRAAKEIAEFLDVEYKRKNLAGIEVVGSATVATNRGFLTHPSVSEEEIRMLTDLFGVPGDTTTVNFGDPFVRTGIVANSKGVIVGEDTSPVELLKIESVLG
jgi:translation initiation factor 6